MVAEMPSFDIGREIRLFMKQSNISAAWLASRMCCDRTNIYKILARKTLDTQTLYRISLFLQHDFFMLFSRELDRLNRETAVYCGIL